MDKKKPEMSTIESIAYVFNDEIQHLSNYDPTIWMRTLNMNLN